MQLALFTITAGDAAALEELNRFLRGHRVLTVDCDHHDGTWSFCVAGQPGPAETVGRVRIMRVDHKEVLDPPTFAIYGYVRVSRIDSGQRCSCLDV